MVRRYTIIKNIAGVSGISVATVSRAMRDTYEVSQQTRRLVLDNSS